MTPELTRADVARLRTSEQHEPEVLPRCPFCSKNALTRKRSRPYPESAYVIGAELYECACGKRSVYVKTFSHETTLAYISCEASAFDLRLRHGVPA